MCACMQGEKLPIQLHVSSCNTRPMNPKSTELYPVCVRHWSFKGRDLYPLVSRLTGCSLIEFFGHWLSKLEAERQSITVQVTWPSFGRFCLQKTQMILHSLFRTHTHTHTHCPKSTVCSVVSDNSSFHWGGTVYREWLPQMALLCKYWDETERNQDVVALLSSVPLTFSFSHIHSHTFTLLALVFVRILNVQ